MGPGAGRTGALLTPEAFEWGLRLRHLGRAAIAVECPTGELLFDPFEAPQSPSLVLLTGEESDRLEGAEAAVVAGNQPEILAAQGLLDWLGSLGDLTGYLPPVQVRGVGIEAMPYTPIPYATPAEAVRKVWSGLRRPDLAAQRLRRRAGRPGTDPVVVALTFPNGSRLVHLGCALHGGTPPGELDRLVQSFGGADWLLVGADFAEQEAVEALVPRFEAGVVLVTDFHNEVRRLLGMPTELLTPLVDRLVERGLQAHPFTRGASYRFEQITPPARGARS